MSTRAEKEEAVLRAIKLLHEDSTPLKVKASIDALLTLDADECDMTVEQFMAWMVNGDHRHESAVLGECGMTSPRDATLWCRLAPGHAEYHNPDKRSS